MTRFIGLPRETVGNRYPFQPSRLIVHVRYMHIRIRFERARAMKTPAAVKENSPVSSLLLACLDDTPVSGFCVNQPVKIASPLSTARVLFQSDVIRAIRE